MNYLSVEDVSKRYGDRLLFSDISFGLDKGQKAGLIARNGTGKTTLLKIIAGIFPPDSGKVVFRNGIRVGFLNQEDIIDEKATVWETVTYENKNPAIEAINQYRKGLKEGKEWEALQPIMETLDRLNGWDIESRIISTLDKLGVNTPDDKVVDKSGGEVKRIMLAKTLLSDADVLILDEPTNHLDLDMIEWLESFLTSLTCTILMVTHDRYFLESICDTILEMEQKTIFKYPGNYSRFLEQKQAREEQLESTIAKAKNRYRTELEWIRRQPKARGTKSKARVDAFSGIEKTAKTRIKDEEISFPVNIPRLGSKIIEFHNISKSFGDKTLLKAFNYKYNKGEKIGLVGRNGSGKSTLLNMIEDKIEPDTGKIVVGETVVIGHYKQEGIQLKEEQRIIEFIRSIADYIPLEKGKKISAEELLEDFLFSRKQQYQYISTLSGGEKRRLYLVSILMKNPNFLILDEPTNDLDIQTITALEEFLQGFKGCVLTVSHDRFFLNKIVDKLLAIQPDGSVREIVGNYLEYKSWILEKQSSEKKTDKKTKPTNTEKPKTKLSYKEKLEFEELDQSIPKLEEKKAKLSKQLSSGIEDFEKIQEISDELERIVKDLDQKTERWMELAEYV